MRNLAEANLSALIESTEDLIWSVDLEYRLIEFNSALRQSMEATFGVQLVVGMPLESSLPPERAALWPPLYERVRTEGPFRVEYSLVNGCILDLSFNPIVVDGETTGVSVFGKDITERKRTEEALRESLDSLSESQRGGGLGSYILDFRTEVWGSSDVMDEIFGIDKDYERTLEGWIALIHPDDRAKMTAYFADEVVGE